MGWRGPMYKSHVILYEAEGSIGSMDKQSQKKNHHEDKETNMITGVLESNYFRSSAVQTPLWHEFIALI